MEIQVQEVRLPGIGMRYDVELGDGRRVFVVAARDGRREIGLRGADDEPGLAMELDRDAAVVLGSLLLGARFVFDTSADERRDADEVVVDSVELTAASPILGRTQSEIWQSDPDALVLAIISEDTPQLVEDRMSHRCRPGDRVVVAARSALIGEVLSRLGGAVRAES